MSELSFAEYRQAVERQSQALLDVIQSVALGDLDVQVDVPEGIEALSELAVGVEMMVDDFREILIEQERARADMEAALSETEALYTGSEQVLRATTVDEVLQAVIHFSAQRFDRASLMLFDSSLEEEGVHSLSITVAATWVRSGEEPLMPAGTRVPVEQFPTASLLGLQEPTIITDVVADERIDENARQIFEGLGVRGMIGLPLVVGGQSIGGIIIQSNAPLDISEEETRRIFSLTSQAAAVIQSLELLEETQARVRREQTLREITARVRGFTDPDVIARSAVRDLGTALGRPAFIRLGSAEDLTRPPGGRVALREGDE